MTADVNMTEKVAQALRREWGEDWLTLVPELGWTVGQVMEDAIKGALSALSDPEVLAGMAGVLREHAIDGRKTWGRVYCACGWVAHEVYIATGYQRHREHVAAALADWFRGQG